MAAFTDKQSRKWNVELDAPVLDKIEQLHKIDLTDLDSDPLLKLRNNPRKLTAVVFLICERQIDEQAVDPQDFGRSVAGIADALLDAVREAIIDFFPCGRASHVREVLTGYAEMAAKTDALALTQMKEVLSDPNTQSRLNNYATKKRNEIINEMFPLISVPGT